MIKKKIKRLIEESLEKTGFKEIPDFLVEEAPKDKKYGDYSTNIAMVLSSSHCKSRVEMGALRSDNPEEIAELIIKNFPEDNIIEKTKVAGPGFINFWLKKEYLKNQIPEILNLADKFGNSDIGRGRKVLIEFISANPTGPLHLGNARGGPLGDVIGNVLQKSGYKVSREFYVNDIGRQANLFAESIIARIKGEEIPQDGYPGEYVKEIAEKIKKEKKIANHPTIVKILAIGIAEMMARIRETIKKMGIKFDDYKYESEYLKSGETQKVVAELVRKGKTKEKDGALWFSSSSAEFLKERESVLKRSKGGEFTYFANDIAYHKDKFRRGFEKLIDVWGANHFGHIARMKEALSGLGLDPDKLDIVLYQYVHLREAGEIKKMAKREGTYITADQVLKVVSSDVLRMMMIMAAPETHLEFDLKLAREQSKKNPVYYVQYAFARISGILARIKNKKSNPVSRQSGPAYQQARTKATNQNLKLLNHKTEIELLKELVKLPDLVEEIAKTYEVHRLPYYAIELAKKFHRFYKNCRVLQAETEELRQARISLIIATRIVLKNVLDLMGINSPEKME